MQFNLKTAVTWVLKTEGGYAERPTEGGGAVNMGITFTVYEAYMKSQGIMGVTFADLKAMPVEIATAIYDQQFGRGIHFDELPSGVDYAVLDAAVLGGVAGSLKILQEALGLEPDGHFGLVTRWAANHRDPGALIDKISEVRAARYKTFKTFKVEAIAAKGDKPAKTWGQIWLERVEIVRNRARSLVQPVSASPAPVAPAAPNYPEPVAPKPVAKGKMPASTALSKEMLKIGVRPEEFGAYLDTVKMWAWRPRGTVMHNTGPMAWPGMANGKPISPEQRLDNISVYWTSRGFKSTPHFMVSPDGMIWLCWPMWKPGTHSPSWNSSHWGIEMVGDFRVEKINPVQRAAGEVLNAHLFAFLGRKPDSPGNFYFHKEDPGTSHKDCPGKFMGSKAEWLDGIKRELVAINPAGL